MVSNMDNKEAAAKLATARLGLDRNGPQHKLIKEVEDALRGRGEPVGQVVCMDDGQHLPVWTNGTPDVGTHLYAAPPPVRVPDERYIKAWPTNIAECQLLLERYDDMVRSLCSYLSVGGFNNPYPKSPEKAEEDIRWGIDHILGVEKTRLNAAPSGWQPPENCRQRLMREGKPYPRSSCQACGKFSPRWKECDAALSVTPSEGGL